MALVPLPIRYVGNVAGDNRRADDNIQHAIDNIPCQGTTIVITTRTASRAARMCRPFPISMARDLGVYEMRPISDRICGDALGDKRSIVK